MWSRFEQLEASNALSRPLRKILSQKIMASLVRTCFRLWRAFKTHVKVQIPVCFKKYIERSFSASSIFSPSWGLNYIMLGFRVTPVFLSTRQRTISKQTVHRTALCLGRIRPVKHTKYLRRWNSVLDILFQNKIREQLTWALHACRSEKQVLVRLWWSCWTLLSVMDFKRVILAFNLFNWELLTQRWFWGMNILVTSPRFRRNRFV